VTPFFEVVQLSLGGGGAVNRLGTASFDLRRITKFEPVRPNNLGNYTIVSLEDGSSFYADISYADLKETIFQFYQHRWGGNL
jgi:hypothetical protein